LWLPFASVRLGMDFARDLCHNPAHHHLAAGPCPAHNKGLDKDARKNARAPVSPGIESIE
ncbi:MAG: hypothetical protein LWW99_10385, partial [Deltaproteobacteria bacterium]|nr:hypothetical protein [Deltaproteobacteria bacterium]